MSFGVIYFILVFLKRLGFIEVVGEGKREKKFYCIIEKGREYFKEYEYEVNEVIEIVECFREFVCFGGRELVEVFKEIFNLINELGEE